jgi:hypothetical protein
MNNENYKKWQLHGMVSNSVMGCWDSNSRELLFPFNWFVHVHRRRDWDARSGNGYLCGASQLAHLKSFGNSYKKARESYKVEENKKDEPR